MTKVRERGIIVRVERECVCACAQRERRNEGTHATATLAHP
jgi:hypothetical protein